MADRRGKGKATGSAPGGDDPDAPTNYQAKSERQLVWAMRGREAGAITEFFARYSGGLRVLARLYRVPEEGREHCVVEFLNDVALELIESARPIPRQMAAYLATAFRHRRQNELRAAARADRRTGAATDESAASGEQMVVTVCSEGAVRASRGPGWEAAPLAPALERLAAALDRGLTRDERLLLTWVSNYVPLREVAAWFGIDRSAAKLRVWRLRARLRKAAVAYAESLDEAEQVEIARFLARAGARPVAPPPPPPTAAPPAAEPPTSGVRGEPRAARTAAQSAGHPATTRSRCNERA